MTRKTGFVRVVLCALTIGAGLGAAVPAQAQSFNFGFGIGGFGIGSCIMTERGLADAIRARGYTNLAFNVPHERRVQVRATRDNWVYLLRVNTCTGEILDRTRLRRSR